MNIRELTKDEFDEFSKNQVSSSFYQTSTYGSLMTKLGYKDLYIGAYKDGTLVAASLILSKTISLNVKYGYAPRGFLIDYLDADLLSEFTSSVKKYFAKKGYAFIKINPILTLSLLDNEGIKTYNNTSTNLISTLENLGYQKLKDNIYFESVLPKYNPIVSLPNYKLESLDNKLQNKINRVSNKGLNFIKGDVYNINSFYELVKNKEDISIEFYKQLYKAFNEKNMVDLFLLEVSYHDYLDRLKKDHEAESVINDKINKMFQLNPNNQVLYNEKLISDNKLNEINEELSKTNIKIQNGIYKDLIATALVIKYKNVANIFISGFNKQFNRLFPNQFLYHSLLEYYKNEGLGFMDLNGITGDYTSSNPYKGLQEFKLSWLPKVYEYIGEFDLVISENKYALLWKTKALQKEFDKKGLKSIS